MQLSGESSLGNLGLAAKVVAVSADLHPLSDHCGLRNHLYFASHVFLLDKASNGLRGCPVNASYLHIIPWLLGSGDVIYSIQHWKRCKRAHPSCAFESRYRDSIVMRCQVLPLSQPTVDFRWR